MSGPYAKYGGLLVEACAKTGTNYCDLTGEPQWHSTMFNLHEAEAKATGARIVHHCGFDSVPSDMGAMVAAKAFRSRFGKDAERIEMTIALRGGGIQGGTIDTVLDFFENGRNHAKLLAKSREGAPELPSKGKTVNEWSKFISWSEGMGKWTVPFFMAGCNQPAVKKSNGRLGYSGSLVYNERQSLPSLFHAVCYLIVMVIFLVLLWIPPTRWILKKWVLPAPGNPNPNPNHPGPSPNMDWVLPAGQGPDMEEMKTKSYKVVFVATGGSNAESVTVRMNAVGDASCVSTTACLGESAMSLSKDAESLTSTGGVMTPAYAMEDVLLQRLKESGKFDITVAPATASQ